MPAGSGPGGAAVARRKRYLLAGAVVATSLLLLLSGSRPQPAEFFTPSGLVSASTSRPIVILPLETRQVVTPPLSPGSAITLDVSYQGTLQLVREGGRVPARDVIPLGASGQCRPVDGWLRCHVSTTVPTEAGLVLYSPTGARVGEVLVRVQRRTHPAPRNSSAVLVVIVLVALSLPAAWILHGHRRASEWMLGGVGIVGVTLLHPAFGLLLAVLLALLWRIGVALRTSARRSFLLATGVALPVGLLVAFKYGGSALSAMVSAPFAFPMGLPLGLSYFAIRLIDTQFRWYRGELRDATFREYIAYSLFPATIVAGPIETLDHFRSARLDRMSGSDYAYGMGRALAGIGKKVVIADVLLGRFLWGGPMSLFDQVTRDPASAPAGSVALLLTLSFAYAYIDFSAYSDIAVGMGRLYGYRIVENFHFPFVARDLRDFWRRWHISLSSWCFRNVYVPLTIATRSTFLPLVVVMLVVGIWHAASASWTAWAFHHAVGLAVLAALQNRARRRKSAGMPRVLATILTLAYVIAGHAFVLIEDFPTALHTYGRFWMALIPRLW